MKCDHAVRYVEAYADGEVRGPRQLLLGRHLRSCASCAARLEEVLAIRGRIRADCMRFAAPASVRARALALSEPRPEAVRGAAEARPWPWAVGGAVAGSLATILLFVFVNAVADRRQDEDLALALVDAHVKATLSERSTQVASSDQHTVKPWLSARLDYSPPVRDLVAQGYPLIGARIERVGDRDVAVLVYHYRLHGVDVYVRPDWPRVAGLERRTIRGFNVLHMTGQGMDWLAVSDASFDALVPFLRELANPSPSR